MAGPGVFPEEDNRRMDAAADQEFKPMRKKDGGINGAGSEDR